jgi:hypothetical protein
MKRLVSSFAARMKEKRDKHHGRDLSMAMDQLCDWCQSITTEKRPFLGTSTTYAEI